MKPGFEIRYFHFTVYVLTIKMYCFKLGKLMFRAGCMWTRMRWLEGKRDKMGITVVLNTVVLLWSSTIPGSFCKPHQTSFSFCAIHNNLLEGASKNFQIIIDVLSQQGIPITLFLLYVPHDLSTRPFQTDLLFLIIFSIFCYSSFSST